VDTIPIRQRLWWRQPGARGGDQTLRSVPIPASPDKPPQRTVLPARSYFHGAARSQRSARRAGGTVVATPRRRQVVDVSDRGRRGRVPNPHRRSGDVTPLACCSSPRSSGGCRTPTTRPGGPGCSHPGYPESGTPRASRCFTAGARRRRDPGLWSWPMSRGCFRSGGTGDDGREVTSGPGTGSPPRLAGHLLLPAVDSAHP
jgi:hypothetical protein